MRQTPSRPVFARDQRKPLSQSKKLANTAIIGLSGLLVAGLGFAFMQGEQVQARNAKSVSSYTPPAVDAPDVENSRFAAVGDSITEANSPDIEARRLGDKSWVYYAQSNSSRFGGGWADGGATTALMAENVEPVTADTLVIVAGTNDVGQGIPFDETSNNIEKIVHEAGVGRVIVSSIPPRDDDPEAATAFNQQLQDLAETQGWEWVDAAAALRDGNTYRDGLTEDGIHPTQKGAKLLGDALQKAINN